MVSYHLEMCPSLIVLFRMFQNGCVFLGRCYCVWVLLCVGVVVCECYYVWVLLCLGVIISGCCCVMCLCWVV